MSPRRTTRFVFVLALLAGRARADHARDALIVASEHGIVELGADQNPTRTLSATPARLPRYVWRTDDLAFLTRDLHELRTVSLAGTDERVVAKLPRTFRVCEGVPDFPAGQRVKLAELDVQSDDDFAVNDGVACVNLQDRNDNMMSVQVAVRVTLATGKVTASCAGIDVATCPVAPLATARDASAALPFRIDAGHLVPATAKPVALDAELSEERESPSGRWVVAGAIAPPEEQGDYVYRRLVLLDRKTGRFFPIRKGAWPQPLRASQLKNLAQLGDRTVMAVGESPLVWLPGDRLVVANLLVTPEVSVVEMAGDLAQ